MREPVCPDIAFQFAVDPVHQIKIETRGHALRIVIRIEQHLPILDQIHPDQQLRAHTQCLAHRTQQVDSGARHHIANGRSGEKAELGQMFNRLGQFDPAHKIGLHRMDRQAGKFVRQILRCGS